MANRKGTFRVGTSGFHYNHWKGIFYPETLSKSEWFSFYRDHFDTVEINNTFYRLPEVKTFDEWRRQAPRGFCYALKFSRYATHIKRLKDPGEPLDKFFSRADRLGPLLGPVLVQLPPNWKASPGRLDAFLDAAPKKRRWAIEFRDPSWLCEEIYSVLKEHGAALCIHDMIKEHPWLVTADLVYLRFHGERYGGSYTHQYLSAQAARIGEQIADGLDVFAYFNNDAQGYAVQNAADLRRYLAGA